MMDFLWSTGAFVVVLGILITVHEFGHFWVARRCGIKVERFSIGFGKALLRWHDKLGTEYVIALIPLGGYVKMLGERSGPIAEELRAQAFDNKSVWQRMAVISAGPIANFLLAVLVYWVVFMVGIPSVKPVIGNVVSGSIAEKAGISPGMELKSIDGVEIPDWDSARMNLVALIGKEKADVGVAVFGSQDVTVKKLDLHGWNFAPDKQDPVVSLGMMPKGIQVEPVLAMVENNSAAARAGLQVNDRILTIDGKDLQSWGDFVKVVREKPGLAVALAVEREGSVHSVTLVPDTKLLKKGGAEGFAGVVPRTIPLPDEYKITRQYGPLTAVLAAVEKTWQLMKLTVNIVGKLITGDVKLSTLSGPISIAQGAGVSAEYGFVPFMLFLALISVNLGVINLFPLPVLDGGHILFLLIEKVKGTPVSEQVQELSYRIGIIMLITLMGLAIFNDFSRF